MIQTPTNYRLSNLISIYINNEMVIEMLRKQLVNISFFDPNIAFNRIDQQRLGYINSKQLSNFLLENRIPSLISDCDLLIRFFDMDEDGMLSYLEFCSVILPATNGSREYLAMNKKYYDYYPGERLNPTIESTLSKLIDAEINAQIQIENVKKYLSDKFDFNASVCFNALAIYNPNYIGADAIKMFMKKMGSPKTDEEVFAFIRRTDKDNDAMLSYSEFYDAVTPLRDFQITKRSNSYNKYNEIQRTIPVSPRYYYVRTPVKRTLSPGRIITTEFDPYLSNEKVTYVSPHKLEYYQPQKIYPVYKNTVLSSDELSIVKTLNEINKYDVYLNDDIRRVIYSPDFDIVLFFKLFDRDSKGYIIFDDLLLAFNEIGLNPTTEEQVLFFKRLDLNSDNKINFDEFCQAFSIKNKGGYIIPVQSVSKPVSLYFSLNTRIAIKSLLSKLISNEVIIDSIKRNLFNQNLFSVKGAFSICDINGNGYLSRDSVRNLLGISSYANVDLIFDRFDRDRDGRISFNDFSEEISPNKVITV